MKVVASTVYSSQGKSPYQENFVLADEGSGILTLSDGFGGAHGFEAAKMAVEMSRDFVLRKSEDLDATMPFELRRSMSLIQNVVNNALAYANASLLKWNAAKHVYERGGASLSFAMLYRDVLTVAQTGSGEVWLERGGKWERLLVGETLGMKESFVGSDWSFRVPLAPLGVLEDFRREVRETRLKAGDKLMIVSGGVESSDLAGVRDLVSKSLSTEEACRVLQQEAQRIGARSDSNVSILLAFFGS